MKIAKLSDAGIFALAFALLVFGFTMLQPRHGEAQFGGQQNWGGTSAGSANVQTINVPNLNRHIPGLVLSFLVGPGLTNTGPVTINPTSIGAVALNRQTPGGVFALSGGELHPGMTATIVYDGTVYELINTSSQPSIGSSHGFRGSVPSGYLVEDGTCFSTSGIYAPLFSVISTTYNAGAPVACSGGQFAVPYSNGTMFLANDSQGAHVAGRVTNAGSGCNVLNTAGTFCGAQNHTMTLAEMAAHNHGNTDGGHTHGYQTPSQSGVHGTTTGGATIPGSTQGRTTGTASINITINSAGGGAAFPVLNPVLSGLRGIKY